MVIYYDKGLIIYYFIYFIFTRLPFARFFFDSPKYPPSISI